MSRSDQHVNIRRQPNAPFRADGSRSGMAALDPLATVCHWPRRLVTRYVSISGGRSEAISDVHGTKPLTCVAIDFFRADTSKMFFSSDLAHRVDGRPKKDHLVLKVILAAGEAALFRQKRRQDVSAAAADGIDPQRPITGLPSDGKLSISRLGQGGTEQEKKGNAHSPLVAGNQS